MFCLYPDRVSLGTIAEVRFYPRRFLEILVHDRGPVSDRHETGVDPNWELQFNPPEWKPWRWIASPFPTVGATPNFTGDTSVLYGGLTYEMSLSNQYADDLTYDITKHLFVGAGISAALHNGPLHKLPHDLLPELRLKRSSGSNV